LKCAFFFVCVGSEFCVCLWAFIIYHSTFIISPVFTSHWNSDEATLVTRLSGPIDLDGILNWKSGLYEAAEKIPADSRFKMLIDIRGYEVADIDREAHKVQREVIPIFLAEHDFRAGYLDLFPEVPDIDVAKRGPVCITVAHVHHDCSKMENYNSRFGRENEQFFCDVEAAEQWLGGGMQNSKL
jgi:hypothetical protein